MLRKHPRSLVCDKCGGKLKFERYLKEGNRYRKYYCPRCGFTEVFKRTASAYY